MLVLLIGAVSVLGQDVRHELTNAHVQQFRHFFDHDFAIDLVLRLIELVLSFFLLGSEHDNAGDFFNSIATMKEGILRAFEDQNIDIPFPTSIEIHTTNNTPEPSIDNSDELNQSHNP